MSVLCTFMCLVLWLLVFVLLSFLIVFVFVSFCAFLSRFSACLYFSVFFCFWQAGLGEGLAFGYAVLVQSSYDQR